MATGTASGKTLPFHVAAIETLAKDPHAKIIAIYPMKALGREQEQRWKKAFTNAGMNTKVGRIDGSVLPSQRKTILNQSQVIVCTPDIIHAWLFSNLSDHKVLSFLRKVKLIVVDEVHTYTGVFGSNAAFLFRRLQHILATLGTSSQYICASATIADPQKHLRNLLGLEFAVVDKESSPKQLVDIHLITPPGEADFLTETVKLLAPLYEKTGKRFITFADSRKQVELITSIIGREGKGETEDLIELEAPPPASSNDDGEVDNPETETPADETIALLDSLNVLPYRAGYEEHDRSLIQARLTQGKLSGVVSTSALELGIDIPFLETCVLIGVPTSSTSFHQRIGRIGRHSKGEVIVINSGDVLDQAVFSNPKSLLVRPLAESALYLENQYVQYIHALCLARIGGEHDQVRTNTSEESLGEFSSPVNWPERFLDVCSQERSGQIPRELQSMKTDAGDNPNYIFPLRDIESQFKVQAQRGPSLTSLGQLSFGQLMREAYPGAVYYYATSPYRVIKVQVNSKIVEVKKEKRYTTKPQKLPTLIFPNLTDDNVFQSFLQADLISLESNLQVRESINGIKERRGSTERVYDYPLSYTLNQPYFTRNYFTTGIVLTHPILNQEGVDVRALAELFFEAFLILIPFERQDINFAADKFRVNAKPIEQGNRFIAIYDQTYGSLRLTSRILDRGALKNILVEARKLADKQELIAVDALTTAAIDKLVDASGKQARTLIFGVEKSKQSEDNLVRVILPGSKGLLLTHNNQDFFVSDFFYTPDGLRYKGKTPAYADSTAVLTPLITHVVEIPGESKIGMYNIMTGEIEELEVFHETKIVPPPPATKPVNIAKLRIVLINYFDENAILKLANITGIDHLGSGNKNEKIEELLSRSEKANLTPLLLHEAFKLFKKQ